MLAFSWFQKVLLLRSWVFKNDQMHRYKLQSNDLSTVFNECQELRIRNWFFSKYSLTFFEVIWIPNQSIFRNLAQLTVGIEMWDEELLHLSTRLIFLVNTFWSPGDRCHFENVQRELRKNDLSHHYFILMCLHLKEDTTSLGCFDIYFQKIILERLILLVGVTFSYLFLKLLLLCHGSIEAYNFHFKMTSFSHHYINEIIYGIKNDVHRIYLYSLFASFIFIPLT